MAISDSSSRDKPPSQQPNGTQKEGSLNTNAKAPGGEFAASVAPRPIIPIPCLCRLFTNAYARRDFFLTLFSHSTQTPLLLRGTLSLPAKSQQRPHRTTTKTHRTAPHRKRIPPLACCLLAAVAVAALACLLCLHLFPLSRPPYLYLPLESRRRVSEPEALLDPRARDCDEPPTLTCLSFIFQALRS